MFYCVFHWGFIYQFHYKFVDHLKVPISYCFFEWSAETYHFNPDRRDPMNPASSTEYHVDIGQHKYNVKCFSRRSKAVSRHHGCSLRDVNKPGPSTLALQGNNFSDLFILWYSLSLVYIWCSSIHLSYTLELIFLGKIIHELKIELIRRWQWQNWVLNFYLL